MGKKRGYTVLMSLLLILSISVLAGCAGKDGAENGGGQNNNEVQEQTYSVTLFFANDAYVVTGDESLEKMKSYETDLKATDDEVYRKTLELLRTVPGEGYSTMIADKIKFNDVSRKDDTVSVDLSSEGLSGGSLEETFFISQIVDTLCGSFSEVKQVQFLVDGQPAETLMGHVGAADPFTKDLFAE